MQANCFVWKVTISRRVYVFKTFDKSKLFESWQLPWPWQIGHSPRVAPAAGGLVRVTNRRGGRKSPSASKVFRARGHPKTDKRWNASNSNANRWKDHVDR